MNDGVIQMQPDDFDTEISCEEYYEPTGEDIAELDSYLADTYVEEII